MGPAIRRPAEHHAPARSPGGERSFVTIDGNQAAAHVAYALNEVIAIYPITPSTSMGEQSDAWSAAGKKNVWGTVPTICEMQSEGGVAGAMHGALQAGALCTTFTASQGLLLMIPNMYKIAGELTPTVIHVSARSVAAQALSIFGDHSDVMACRSTGWAMLAAGGVQEIMDMALVASAATLESRLPFVHFFDGFRSSHEIQKVEALSEADMRAMVPDHLVRAHRSRALTPDRPVVRGTAQNPDVFFQGREAVNPYYLDCPHIVQTAMDRLAERTGRSYHLFDYVGAADADKVIVLMGSGAEAVHETVTHLVARGEKIGVVKVRLFRPFSAEHLAMALPPTVKSIAALDRTKEPGSIGEPLYQDVVTAIAELSAAGKLPTREIPRVIGGRYGLSSKEFTPGMIRSIFDELGKGQPKNHFTIGIDDDVTNTSLEYDPRFFTEDPLTFRALFYGLGSDGTVSANKNSIKIIGEGTNDFAQGYFVYDSKKSGSMTVSHLRFGPKPIRSTYLIDRAEFIGCHQWAFLERLDVLKAAMPKATLLLNSGHGPEKVWGQLPREVQEQILEKDIRLFVIDAYKVAREAGLGLRINTVMQTCFFAVSGVLPREAGSERIKEAIRKTYGRAGEEVVQKNFAAVDAALAALVEVEIPETATGERHRRPPVSPDAPPFVKNFTAEIIAGRGDEIPVSKMPADGTFPTGTSKWEKRSLALDIPVWDTELCVQCGRCALVCPHAAIRFKMADPAIFEDAPATFKTADAMTKEFAGKRFALQVSPDDCTGCTLCVDVCPAHAKDDPSRLALEMAPIGPLQEAERENFEYFLEVPNYPREEVKRDTVRGVGLLEPLFEFSGACAACGETPYVKTVSQLFGDRSLVANATGCSSIYGGNLPTTPWTVNAEGRGPAWSNSLFEDNAEFGLGFRLTVDKLGEIARGLTQKLAAHIGDDLVQAILEAEQKSEVSIAAQRERVAILKKKLERIEDPDAENLLSVADYLVEKCVWIVGGDGWAYDIGYGGLDHVIASGHDVNILVLDSEVYSNTGGQASKATPRAAVAKFAASGKPMAKKDLALLAMTYGGVYVARVAMGANPGQAVKAIVEAESYDGPSLVIGLAQCVAHGIDMASGMSMQKLAVDSGHWPIFRYDPRRVADGKSGLQLDSKPPSVPYKEYAYSQGRFRMLADSRPEEAEALLRLAEQDVKSRWEMYERLAGKATAPAS